MATATLADAAHLGETPLITNASGHQDAGRGGVTVLLAELPPAPDAVAAVAAPFTAIAAEPGTVLTVPEQAGGATRPTTSTNNRAIHRVACVI